MNTDDLIDSLAKDAKPIASDRAAWRVACCVGMGMITALALVGLTIGFRADLNVMASDAVFLFRQAYTLSIAGFAALLLLRLGQPGAPLRLPLIGLTVTASLVLIAVIVEQSALPDPARLQGWLGHSWSRCASSITIIGLITTPFLFIAARRLAPTKPTLAGFAAGLVSGALSASAYGLYCTEGTVSFMASWYTLGILATGIVGAAAGRYLLRW